MPNLQEGYQPSPAEYITNHSIHRRDTTLDEENLSNAFLESLHDIYTMTDEEGFLENILNDSNTTETLGSSVSELSRVISRLTGLKEVAKAITYYHSTLKKTLSVERQPVSRRNRSEEEQTQLKILNNYKKAFECIEILRNRYPDKNFIWSPSINASKSFDLSYIILWKQNKTSSSKTEPESIYHGPVNNLISKLKEDSTFLHNLD